MRNNFSACFAQEDETVNWWGCTSVDSDLKKKSILSWYQPQVKPTLIFIKRRCSTTDSWARTLLHSRFHLLNGTVSNINCPSDRILSAGYVMLGQDFSLNSTYVAQVVWWQQTCIPEVEHHGPCGGCRSLRCCLHKYDQHKSDATHSKGSCNFSLTGLEHDTAQRTAILIANMSGLGHNTAQCSQQWIEQEF